MRRRPESQSSPLATVARAGDPQRRGATLVLFAFLVVALLAMVAFGVDTGYILHIKTELKRAADAGALAGAGRLVDGEAEAVAEITQFVQMNLVGQEQVQGGDLQVEFGDWDEAAKVFTPGAEVPSAVRVRLERNDQPLFFGRVFGREMFDTQAESIAMYQPRDIMLVLDYSGSMNDDSELRSISTIGQSNVEANLAQIYTELGAPTFGNMQWTPVHISSNDDNFVLNQLGLNGVPYPYPGGSWLDYINYVQGSGYINAAGYQKDYGYLTWVNYLLERKPKSNETPDLWQTSEQPVTQVKNAVTIFLAYMQQVETDDRVGLSLYNSVAQTSVLESELTNDYAVIANIAQQRQAGHYDVWTNIGSGMQTARTELENNARPGAFRMMILMTDGIANKPTDTTVARQFVLDEAALAAAAGIPIVTISLGVNADAALMQSVADITNGVHFNVPGGEGVLQYEEQLEDVFKEVADDRPLKLVQ